MLRTLLYILVIASCCCACQSNSTSSSTPTSDPSAPPPSTSPTKSIILFFGNSLTAGYGVELEEAFPNLIQKRLDSLQFPYQVVNAGLSGETSAGGNSRIDWILEQQAIDIFFLELGANDGLRGLKTEETLAQLREIMQKVRAKNPKVKIVLAGMEAPPNMGDAYTAAFRKVFKTLHEEEGVVLMPFFLEGVAGDPALNVADGIHPNPAGHRIVAEGVWSILQPLL